MIAGEEMKQTNKPSSGMRYLIIVSLPGYLFIFVLSKKIWGRKLVLMVEEKNETQFLGQKFSCNHRMDLSTSPEESKHLDLWITRMNQPIIEKICSKKHTHYIGACCVLPWPTHFLPRLHNQQPYWIISNSYEQKSAQYNRQLHRWFTRRQHTFEESFARKIRFKQMQLRKILYATFETESIDQFHIKDIYSFRTSLTHLYWRAAADIGREKLPGINNRWDRCTGE